MSRTIIEIIGEDLTGPATTSASRNVQSVARATQQAFRDATRAQRDWLNVQSQGNQQATKQTGQLSDALAAVVGRYVSVGAAVEGARRSFLLFANEQQSFRQMAVQTGRTWQQLTAELKPMFNEWSRSSGVAVEDIMAGFNELREASRYTIEDTGRVFPEVLKMHKITGASMADIAKAVGVAHLQMGIGIDQTKEAMAALIDAQGQYNINVEEMMRWGPRLITLMSQAGFKGVEGWKQMLVLMGSLNTATGNTQQSTRIMLEMFNNLDLEPVGRRIGKTVQGMRDEMATAQAEGKNTFGVWMGWMNAALSAGLKWSEVPIAARIAYEAWSKNAATMRQEVQGLGRDVDAVDKKFKEVTEGPRAEMDKFLVVLKAFGTELGGLLGMLASPAFANAAGGIHVIAESLKTCKEMVEWLVDHGLPAWLKDIPGKVDKFLGVPTDPKELRDQARREADALLRKFGLRGRSPDVSQWYEEGGQPMRVIPGGVQESEEEYLNRLRGLNNALDVLNSNVQKQIGATGGGGVGAGAGGAGGAATSGGGGAGGMGTYGEAMRQGTQPFSFGGGRGAAATGPVVDQVTQQLRAAGMPDSGIAAVLGTIQQESSFNPNAQSGVHRGLFQHEPSRQPADSSVGGQVSHFMAELQKRDPAGWKTLMDPNASLDDKMAVMNRYEAFKGYKEGRAGAETGGRYGYAEEYLRRIQPAPSPASYSPDGGIDTRPPGMQAAPMGEGAVRELQSHEARTRRGALAGSTRAELQYASAMTGLVPEVYSGGQPAYGPNRVGSHRHDYGGAGDLRLWDPAQKRYLDMRNPDDARRMAAFVEHSVAAGATGVGAGTGYMGPRGLHIGGGSAASWGGAPWIEAARRRGMARRLSPQQVQAAIAQRQQVAGTGGVPLPHERPIHPITEEEAAAMESSPFGFRGRRQAALKRGLEAHPDIGYDENSRYSEDPWKWKYIQKDMENRQNDVGGELDDIYAQGLHKPNFNRWTGEPVTQTIRYNIERNPGDRQFIRDDISKHLNSAWREARFRSGWDIGVA